MNNYRENSFNGNEVFYRQTKIDTARLCCILISNEKSFSVDYNKRRYRYTITVKGVYV